MGTRDYLGLKKPGKFADKTHVFTNNELVQRIAIIAIIASVLLLAFGALYLVRQAWLGQTGTDAGSQRAANSPATDGVPIHREGTASADTGQNHVSSEKSGSASATSQTVSTAAFEKEVQYSGDLTGYLCKPQGSGPLPAVMFNHGGSGEQIGGDPKGMCSALKEAGYVGFSPIRTTSKSADDNLENVSDAFTYLESQGYVDTGRLATIGFSRGVMLSYDLATKNPGQIKVLVLMAGSIPSQYAAGYSNAGKLTAPVLLLVAENDTPAKLNGNQNMVELMQTMDANLASAGVTCELNIYPPYEQGHGHTMFFEIGDYFDDIQAFLGANL